MPGSRDIALISLGTTPGLRRADAAFADAAVRAGVACEVVPVRLGAAGKLRRQITVTDLVEARAAERAARSADATVRVYSTVTAALLRPRPPYAIRFDAPAALNRPGVAGAWQRAAERRAMAGAAVLLPWGRAAADAIPKAARSVKTIPLHVPVTDRSLDRPMARSSDRSVDVLAYAGYPEKRGLDILVRAWASVARPDRTLVVAGIERERAEAWLRGRGVPVPANVEWRGLLKRSEWAALLARTRIFVNASRREDHGLSQLEALAAGAMLVTVPSVGPYEALPIARRLDERFVSVAIEAVSLTRALAAALDSGDGDGYAARAQRELAPYTADAVQRAFEAEVLPALGLR